MQEQHSRKLFVYGKSDNDIGGLQKLLSYSCAGDALSDSEKELPVEVFFLGPYPDQNHLFGQNCEGYDASTLESELDDVALERLRKWGERDSHFLAPGGRKDRKRVLKGFERHPYSTQMNGFPKQEVADMWEKQIKKNESLDM